MRGGVERDINAKENYSQTVSTNNVFTNTKVEKKNFFHKVNVEKSVLCAGRDGIVSRVNYCAKQFSLKPNSFVKHAVQYSHRRH